MKKLSVILAAILAVLTLASCVAADKTQVSNDPLPNGDVSPTSTEEMVETETPTPIPTPPPSADELFYIDYMNSNRWLEDYVPRGGEEVEPQDLADYKIKRYTVFDLDGDGVEELLFSAVGEWGDASYIFCRRTEDGVEQLLQGYVSSGTVGGETVEILFDTTTDEYVLCMCGWASGFGGMTRWIYVYDYVGGVVTPRTSVSMSTYTSENYELEELEDPLVYAGENDMYTTYGIDGERVTIEEWQAANHYAGVDGTPYSIWD